MVYRWLETGHLWIEDFVFTKKVFVTDLSLHFWYLLPSNNYLLSLLWSRTHVKSECFSVYIERWFQNDLYWDDWSRMGIFKAPKAGSQNNELIVGRLTGVMDLKIFYKGKNRGEEHSSPLLWSWVPCSGYVSGLVMIIWSFSLPYQGIMPVPTSHAVCCVSHNLATNTPVFVRRVHRPWPYPMESCSASVPLVTSSKTTPAPKPVSITRP